MTDPSTSHCDPDLALAVQQEVRLALPRVSENVDYEYMERMLNTIDEALRTSGIEDRFILGAVDAAASDSGQPLSDKHLARLQKFAKRSLRCNVARLLCEESFRYFSVHLADSYLLRRFCLYDGLDDQSASKSTLQRMFTQTSEAEVRSLVTALVAQAGSVDDDGAAALGTADPLSLSNAYIDTTCLPLDIHYPTDWVLLRDLTRSIVQRIEVIRGHGIRCRIRTPSSFVSEMNAMCIAMAAASRRGGRKKERKRVLRRMKKHLKTVCQHGRRYLNALERRWTRIGLSKQQKGHIAKRLSTLLDLAPRAIKQAHERIIGERSVENDEKLLSIYEPHARVYVRGKAGANCEFGLQCLIAESSDGLIMDWHLPGDHIVPDTKALVPSVQRMIDAYGESTLESVITDRGFTSHHNTAVLADMDIVDFTLPRNPQELQQRMTDPIFAEHHRRRAQTEARIGIFKNQFTGSKIPAKGLANQRTHVAWAALAHNLWVIARIVESDWQEARAAA